MNCGCEQRRATLNQWRPGLGDAVKVAIRLAPIALGLGALMYWRKR